jgi:D-glycero-D-manno-heptose 1,7-bisphosphate phosphatase
MRAAVFLDRDGILNRLVVRDGCAVSPRSFSQFEVLPGVAGALERLKRLGFLAIGVTNQPDIARGFLKPEDLERMHEYLRTTLPLDAIYTCPHVDGDGCACRKPKPGLLLRGAAEWQIRLEDSWVVGDSWKDLEAGRAARCNTCLVRTSATGETPSGAMVVVSSLAEAVNAIVINLQGQRSAQTRDSGEDKD